MALTKATFAMIDGAYINVLDYGVDSTGATNSTAEIQAADTAAAAAGKTLWFPDGNYLISDLICTAPWNMATNAWLKADTGVYDLITASLNDSVIGQINIDANNKSTHTSFYLTGSNNSVVKIQIKNINADLGTGTVTGCVIAGNNNNIDVVEIRDSLNTGNANGSMPQAMVFWGSSENNTVASALFTNVQSGIVTASSGTKPNHVSSISVQGAVDNGIYNLGTNLFSADTFYYYGEDEPIVAEGNLSIGVATIDRALNACIGVQDAQYVHIGQLIMNGGGRQICKTRAGNTASVSLVIGEVIGYYTSGGLMDMSIGTVKNFSINKINIRYLYDNTSSGTISQWCNISACKGFSLKNWDISIIDVNNVLTSTDYFYVTLPTTNLTVKSYLKNIDVLLFNSDGLTPSAAGMRGYALSNNLIEQSGLRWQVNVGPYFREATYSLPDSTYGVPTGGYWYQGKILWNNSVAAGGSPGWVCTTAGNPGTWKAMANVAA